MRTGQFCTLHTLEVLPAHIFSLGSQIAFIQSRSEVLQLKNTQWLPSYWSPRLTHTYTHTGARWLQMNLSDESLRWMWQDLFARDSRRGISQQIKCRSAYITPVSCVLSLLPVHYPNTIRSNLTIFPLESYGCTTVWNKTKIGLGSVIK